MGRGRDRMVAHVLLLLDYRGHRGRDHMVAHVLLLLDYRGRDHMVAHVLLLLDVIYGSSCVIITRL